MRRLAALLFCSAALLAGCGSDDEQTTSPAADGTPTPEQEQPQDRGSYGY
jgi:major membrane immunogen (membrane-anchored lipoprotein)